MPQITYPVPKFRFEVKFGNEVGRFTEVSGLETETEPIEYRDSGIPLDKGKSRIPGMKKYGNITLKKGVFAGDDSFKKFIEEIITDRTATRSITITLKDEESNSIVTWAVENAWATKYTGTDLKADANEIAIETLEIAHTGITVEFK